MSDTRAEVRSGWWRPAAMTALSAGLALLGAGCGLFDGGGLPGADDDDVVATDGGHNGDDDGNGDGSEGGDGGEGGSRWPRLPGGPEIPDFDEIDIYAVLAAAEAESCADLFADGAVVTFQDRTTTARFSASPPGNFRTGSRTYHLYRAAANLCAGDEDAAETAFESALSESWTEPLDPDNANLQLVACRVWDAVTALLDPGAGTCTLEVDEEPEDADDPDPDDPDPDPDDPDADHPGPDETTPGTDDGNGIGDGDSGDGEGGSAAAAGHIADASAEVSP